MRSDSFSEALGQLDPASRALLDLSLRRGMRPDEIADILGAEANTVALSRDEALQRVATAMGMDGEEQLDEVRARLAELPAEEWIGPRVTSNGDQAPVARPEPRPAARSPQPAEVAGPAPEVAPPAPKPVVEKPPRNNLPAIIGVGIAAIIAALAITSGSSDDSSDSTSQPAPPPTVAQKPPPAKPAPPPSAPPPSAPPAAKPPARIAAVLNRRVRGSASLIAGGTRVKIDVRGLPTLRGGTYGVWLYNSVIASRPIDRSTTARIHLTARLPGGWRRFRHIDISFEPKDGNPSHSGQSVARLATRNLR